MKRWVPCFSLLLLLPPSEPLRSQVSEPDSIVYAPLPVPDTSLAGGDPETATFVMSKKPWLAVSLSAALPGAGQFYNESYWKIPIVTGLGGYFIYEWIRNDRLAEDYRVLYEESKTEDNPTGNLQHLYVRDFYKDQRDTFVWYFAILYVANLVDAYVDASLYDFDVGDRLSLRVVPELGVSTGGFAGVRLNMTF
jgi:hypothetical protein